MASAITMVGQSPRLALVRDDLGDGGYPGIAIAGGHFDNHSDFDAGTTL